MKKQYGVFQIRHGIGGIEARPLYVGGDGALAGWLIGEARKLHPTKTFVMTWWREKDGTAVLSGKAGWKGKIG